MFPSKFRVIYTAGINPCPTYTYRICIVGNAFMRSVNRNKHKNSDKTKTTTYRSKKIKRYNNQHIVSRSGIKYEISEEHAGGLKE